MEKINNNVIKFIKDNFVDRKTKDGRVFLPVFVDVVMFIINIGNKIKFKMKFSYLFPIHSLFLVRSALVQPGDCSEPKHVQCENVVSRFPGFPGNWTIRFIGLSSLRRLWGP